MRSKKFSTIAELAADVYTNGIVLVHLSQLARNRSERLVAACLVLRPLTRLRQSLNDDAFISCLQLITKIKENEITPKR